MNSDIQLLLQKKASGEMTMNQVYQNASGDSKASFKDFLSNAIDKGWVDQGLNATSSILHSKYGAGATGGALISETPCLDGYEKNADNVCVPVRKSMSTGVKIGIGVGALAIVGVVIYIATKKD